MVKFSETLCLYEKEKSTRQRVDALNKVRKVRVRPIERG